MGMFNKESAASRPTPGNDLRRRINKSIAAQVYTSRTVGIEENRINRLVHGTDVHVERLRDSLNGIVDAVAINERMGSEIGFASAMRDLGYSEGEIMRIWHAKIAVDRKERGLTRRGLPGFSRLSGEADEQVLTEEQERMTRYLAKENRFTESDTFGGRAEDIFSALADPEQAGVDAVREMLIVANLKEEEAERLSEPFADTPAEDAINVSIVVGIAHQNERWAGAVVADEDISPDHAEQIIARRFEDLSSLYISEAAGLTMDDAREIARETSLFDDSLERALSAQFQDGRSYSNVLWLGSFMSDDEISASHIGNIAAAVSNDFD